MDIVEEILIELDRAEKKFTYWPNDIIHAAAIVSEEAGELIKAAVQYEYEGGGIYEIKMEAIQTAAMCIRLLKNIKTNK